MWNIPLSCEPAEGAVDLFSDLDNTLIYSHRVPLPEDKVLAERLNGAEQSFMTGRTFRFFQRSQVRLIPVTTRSREQFQRIFLLGTTIPCRYALVCNGGELLIDGESDPRWLEESRALAAQALTALPQALAALHRTIPPEHVHAPSGLLAYGRCGDPEQTARSLRAQLPQAELDVLWDSRKVYCIPRSLNKGAALERFKRRFSTGFVVAAGDSAFDLPLLRRACLAVAAPSLQRYLGGRHSVAPDCGQLLSDRLCAELERLEQRRQ